MLEAVFITGVDEITVSGLTQWDRGQAINITCPDLPTLFQVHFSYKGSKKALSVNVLDTTIVNIPDELLTQPRDLIAWVYLYDETTGETVKTINLPLEPRAKPEDYIEDLTPTQLERIEALLVSIDEKANSADLKSDGAATVAGNALAQANTAKAAADNAVNTANTANARAQTAVDATKDTQLVRYVDSALVTQGGAKVVVSKETTVTLTVAGWTQDATTERYYQTASVAFMTADIPVVVVDLHYSGDVDADDAMEFAYMSNIYRMTQGAGSVTFWAKVLPEVNVQIDVGVI